MPEQNEFFTPSIDQKIESMEDNETFAHTMNQESPAQAREPENAEITPANPHVSLDNNINIVEPPPYQLPCVVKILLYGVPIATAAVEATQTASGDKSSSLRFVAGGIQFLSSFFSSGQFARDGIRNTIENLATKKGPRTISSSQLIVTIGTTAAISIVASSFDAIQAEYFSSQLPEVLGYKVSNTVRSTMAIAIAIPYFISTLCGEGNKIFHSLYNWFTPKYLRPASLLPIELQPSKCVSYSSKGIGGTLGIAGAVYDTLLAYSSIEAFVKRVKHDPNSPLPIHPVWILTSCALANGVSDFFSNGKFIIKSLEAFFNKLSNPSSITKFNVISLLLALSGGSLVGRFTGKLTENFLNNIISSLELQDAAIVEPLVIAISSIIILSNGVSCSSSLYNSLSKFGDYAVLLGNKMCGNKEVEIVDENVNIEAGYATLPVEESAPLVANHLQTSALTRYGVFSRPPTETPLENKPTSRWKTACTIM